MSRPTVRAALRASLAAPLLAVALGGGGAAPVHAEDATAPTRFPTRVFDVGDLTWRRPEHRAERVTWLPMPDQVNDEERPLFGGEGEETWSLYGGTSELMERVKADVGDPDAWSHDGVRLRAAADRALAVTAPPALLDAVGAYLDRLRGAAHATFAVDVAVLAGDPTLAADGPLAPRIGRGLAPVAVTRVHAMSSARAAAFGGRTSTYVQDYDVEVAQKAMIGDPIVGVRFEGLAVSVAVLSLGATLRLDLEAAFATPAGAATSKAPETGPITLPTLEVASVVTVVDVTPGTWTALPSRGAGASGTVFAVRASQVPAVEVGGGGRALELRPASADAPGPLATEDFDVRDLYQRTVHRRGISPRVWSSNYTPPEPPELPEPMPRFDHGDVAELVKEAVLRPYLDTVEGARVELAGGFLRVRADAPRRRAVAEALAAMRAYVAPTTRVRATVVAVPRSSVPELFADGGLEGALVADGAAALLARPRARVLGRTSLRLLDDQRGAAESGRTVSYVGDYDVEIAEAATIGNPIVRTLFAGTVLDVRATPAGRGGLALDVRFTQSDLAPMTSFPTTSGDLSLPSLGITRTAGLLAVPSGATRVLDVALDGDDVVLTLLSVARD